MLGMGSANGRPLCSHWLTPYPWLSLKKIEHSRLSTITSKYFCLAWSCSLFKQQLLHPCHLSKKGYLQTHAHGIGPGMQARIKSTSKHNQRKTKRILSGMYSWWRHQMDTFSALLALFVGNYPATGEFPVQRSVTRSFDVFFELLLNKRWSKQSWGWWFETPSSSLWRHCNDIIALLCAVFQTNLTNEIVLLTRQIYWALSLIWV